MNGIRYSSDQTITVDQFVDLLHRSTLGERRPVKDGERMGSMIKHANLLGTAWDGSLLIGVARSLTDFAYCCYLSDLAVDVKYQKRGIGTALIRLTQSRLHPEAKIILLAAPMAAGYYPKIGMQPHPSAWIIAASASLNPG